MTAELFYGDAFPSMKKAEQQLLDLADIYQELHKEKEDVKAIVYCSSRIKSPESMIRKLKQRK